VESVQSHIANWLQVNASLIGTTLAVSVVAGIGVVWLVHSSSGGSKPLAGTIDNEQLKKSIQP
jgi:hypothetical protein